MARLLVAEASSSSGLRPSSSKNLEAKKRCAVNVLIAVLAVFRTFGLILLLVFAVSQLGRCQNLPDAPSALPRDNASNRPSASSLKPITWRHTFDWKFGAVHGVYFAAMMWDQHETLKGEAAGCALEAGDPPYYAHRGDLMKKNLPFFAGIFVVDAIVRKVGMPIAWLAAPSVATVKHVQGGVHWVHLCG